MDPADALDVALTHYLADPEVRKKLGVNQPFQVVHPHAKLSNAKNYCFVYLLRYILLSLSISSVRTLVRFKRHALTYMLFFILEC